MFCGLGAGAHRISLTQRPAHRLAGWYWQGSFAEAREGAIKPLLLRARDLSERSSGSWRSPIVGLTWNLEAAADRPAGLRHFVGIAADDAPKDGATLDVPAMTFASAWHAADDGGVVEHYMRMIEWIGDEGHERDVTHFAQREEYPNTYDPGEPLSLRLLMPVKDDASEEAAQ
jgi:hypothetical protein